MKMVSIRIGLAMLVGSVAAMIATSALSVPTTSFGAGVLNRPIGVTVAGTGDVYVADRDGNRVAQFTSAGTLIRTWAHSFPSDVASDASGIYVAAFTVGAGSGNGEVAKYTLDGATKLWSFTTPASSSSQSVATNGTSVYVAADNDRKIRVLNASTGALTATWSMPVSVSAGVAARPGGGLYVYDWSLHRIASVSAAGAVEGTFATLPRRSGNYRIAVDADGKVYAEEGCASADSRFLVYAPSGDLVAAVAKGGVPAGCVAGFAVAKDGNLFAASSAANRITVYDLLTPSVALAVSDERPLTGEEVRFTADASVGIGEVSGYDWDLNGDGAFERTTTVGAITTAYDSAGARAIRVRAVTAAGRSATTSEAITVFAAPPPGEPGMTINDASPYTNNRNVTLSVVWPPFATAARISNDGGFRASTTVIRALAPTYDWQLDDSVKALYTKIVYVRFSGSGIDETKTYTDDIILDLTPPSVIRATAVRGVAANEMAAKPRQAKTGTVIVRLTGSDGRSGVKKMQVTAKRSAPGAERPYSRSVRIKSNSGRMYVRVLDGAGNWSKWRTVPVCSGNARARASCLARARANDSYRIAIDRAKTIRAASLEKCSGTPKSTRACRARANARFRYAIGRAAAIRTRQFSLVACTAKRGAARRACQARANARFRTTLAALTQRQTSQLARARR